MTPVQIVPMRPTDILLIEDDASDAYLLSHALESTCTGEFGVTPASSVEAALPLMSLQRFDVALLDLSLPGSSGLEALQQLRHAAPPLPIVILTGFDDEALALSALQHGAQDYLVKEQADGQLIKRAIRYAIERKRFEDNLTVLANFDALTGLANRSLFESRLEMALARARRSGETPALFFIDLNGFKSINDRLGHKAGDALLKGVAGRLKRTVREYDTVARFGGDEFAVLLEGAMEPRGCAIVARKMLDAMHTPFTLEKGEETVGLSLGIAIAASDTPSEQLLKQADIAMYRAKQKPKSSYQFYTENLHRETALRLQMEQELAHALRHRESLCLYYQPKLELKSGRLAGAEALIRWQHPERGLLLPEQFLPLLPPGLGTELDVFVLEMACADTRRWQAMGLEPVQISIHISNIGGEQDSIDALLAVLDRAGLSSRTIAMEIEESALLHDEGGSVRRLARVRDAGVELHLDNFGSGTSSLRLLARCPLDAVKIDRRLTSILDVEERETAMLRSLINLGHTFDMKVIAEGVESSAQQTALRAMECDQMQGYLIARPLSEPEFSRWLSQQLHASAL